MSEFLCGLFKGHRMAPIKVWIATYRGKDVTITQQDCTNCSWSDRHWIWGVPK